MTYVRNPSLCSLLSTLSTYTPMSKVHMARQQEASGGVQMWEGSRGGGAGHDSYPKNVFLLFKLESNLIPSSLFVTPILRSRPGPSYSPSRLWAAGLSNTAQRTMSALLLILSLWSVLEPWYTVWGKRLTTTGSSWWNKRVCVIQVYAALKQHECLGFWSILMETAQRKPRAISQTWTELLFFTEKE